MRISRGNRKGSGRAGCSGFTLAELMIAIALSGFVLTAGYVALRDAARYTRAGGYQAAFNAQGRKASRKLTYRIEQGKAVGITSGGVDIVTINLDLARIYYVDSDSDPDTVEDNMIIYDPDTAVADDEEVVATHVTPLEGEPMFSIATNSPGSVQFRFHIGDGTNTSYTCFSGTGEGYQGVEIRFSATPRNPQRWYD